MDGLKRMAAWARTATEHDEFAPSPGFIEDVAITLASLARDLRANIQILDEIAQRGPVGVRLAVRRVQGESHPPWPGAEPVEWKKTATGERYQYVLNEETVWRLLRTALGFDSSYRIEPHLPAVDRIDKSLAIVVSKGEA